MSHEQRRLAIIVGVGSYDDSDGINDLRYSVNDAQRLHQVLLACKGFSTDDCYLICDDPKTDAESKRTLPTKPLILKTLKHVCEKAQPDDLVLFFFAGHGVEVSSRPYLLTSDTQLDVLKHTALDVEEMNELLKKCRAQCILRIFDACRSGYSQGRTITERMSTIMESALFAKATGWVTFSACKSNETAHEDAEFEQGVFTYYLCEGLSGGAGGKDGIVTLDTLVDYVKRNVAQWCGRQTQTQTPHIECDLSGSLVLSTTQPLTEARTDEKVGPFAGLGSAIDAHLASMQAETRQMQFTEDGELEQVATNMFERLDQRIQAFSHPCLDVAVGEVVRASSVPGVVERIQKSAQNAGLASELTEHGAMKTIQFMSKEAAVPPSQLVVVAVRFSFFYWLWYEHSCAVEFIKTRFRPQPQLQRGFITLKPTSAKNPGKVQEAVDEILSRASVAILEWAGQGRDFLTECAEKLRRAGSEVL